MSSEVTEKMKDAAGWTIHGAALSPLESKECELWLNWLDGGSAPHDAQDVQWAVAQWEQAFGWGMRDGERWKWGEAEPAERGALLEVRLFGPKVEALIWRHREGYRGRILTDTPCDKDVAPLKKEVYRIQLDPVSPKPPTNVRPAPGFVVRAAPGGNITVMPEIGKEHGGYIEVCHYVSECPETGVLRITVTRFAGLGAASSPQNGGL